MSEKLQEAYQTIIDEIRERMKRRLLENQMDELTLQEVIKTQNSLVNGTQNAQSINSDLKRSSLTDQRKEQIIAEIKKRITIENESLSNALRILIRLFENGEEYKSSILWDMIRESELKSLTKNSPSGRKTFTATMHAVSKDLADQREIQITTTGRGAGNETVYRRIKTN